MRGGACSVTKSHGTALQCNAQSIFSSIMFRSSRFSGLTFFTALWSLLVVLSALKAPELVLPAAAINALLYVLVLFLGPPSEKIAGTSSWIEGSYEILDTINEGGMGIVCRARHRGLDRIVAHKSIRPALRTKAARARFQREAKVLAGLTNPHTIDVFDAGVSNDKSLFYVMEYLEGLDLGALVDKEGPLVPARVVHILRQASLSLCEAHEKGLVHRDLKPANLMVCRYGGEYDFVKVLDFGLVKTLRGNEKESIPPITAAGEIPGTPAFLAPETILGSRFVDARTDIYAMGAIGHYLLTGQFLFDADSPLKMVQAHLNEEPPRASERAPYSIPSHLDDLIARCLEKDPNGRPQSALDLLASLESLMVELPWKRHDAAKTWSEFRAA